MPRSRRPGRLDSWSRLPRAQGLALTCPGGLLTGLTKQMLETALEVEMAEHLDHDRGERSTSGNLRNGSCVKTVRTDVGDVRIAVPRDRAGTFTPAVVPKHARRLAGFDEAVLLLYAKGMTTGDIANHLADVYGTDVSRDLVSRFTDADRSLHEPTGRFTACRWGPPAQNPPGIGVDGERDVHHARAGRAVGEVGDPQPVRRRRAEPAAHQIRPLRLRPVRDRCADPPTAAGNSQPELPHQSFGRAAGDRDALPIERQPALRAPWTP